MSLQYARSEIFKLHTELTELKQILGTQSLHPLETFEQLKQI